MSIHNTLLILFAIVFSLLFSSYGMAHACKQGVKPRAQEQVDAAAYDSSAVEKIWNFENYTFSFALPEAMEGYFYPNPYMIRGVVFPLGPQKKPEEHRELLIWAHYNALEHNEDDLKKDHKSNVEWLAKLDASLPHKKWRTFEERHGGLRFFCAEIRGDSIWFIQALAFGPENTILYRFSLLSPKSSWDADYALFKHALATFELYEPLGASRPFFVRGHTISSPYQRSSKFLLWGGLTMYQAVSHT